MSLPEMSFEDRYRAVCSRDARWDGQFVTAVRTTGIYCRPSCPARTPQPANVEFFATSAAAHEAGYRACKRCLPEAVPGSPQWDVRGDTVGRAMGLIAEGLVDREGVTGLAARLGYSPRHVSRLLREVTGAGPIALARAQRASTARLLLTHTSLPVSQIAFAAGFSSLRQFNDTIREVFDLTPGQIRAHRNNSTTTPLGASVIRVWLGYRAPFDAAGLWRWLAARAVDRVETAVPAPNEAERHDTVPSAQARHTEDRAGGYAAYERTLMLPGGPAWFRVELPVGVGLPASAAPVETRATRHSARTVQAQRASSAEPAHRSPTDHDSPARWHSPGSRGRDRDGVLLTARVSTPQDLPPLIARVRGLLDLDADPAAVDPVLARVPGLAPFVAATPGLRVPGCVDPHELLIRTMVGQQISVPAARTVLSDLVRDLGEPVTAPAGLDSGSGASPDRLFPTMAAIAEHGDRVVRGPRRRVAAIVGVAAALASGDLELRHGDDALELRARLLALPGVGPWTADYVRMRVCRDPDVLLTSDAALRAAARRAGLPHTVAQLETWGRSAAPWRSYLTGHVWRASATPGVSAPPQPSATPASASTFTPSPTPTNTPSTTTMPTPTVKTASTDSTPQEVSP